MQRLKERLVSRRHSLNLSQVELAERSGVSERAIASYESGEGRPTHSKVEKLAKALSVTPLWLLGSDEPAALQDAPPGGADPESVRLALRALKSQVLSVADQISFYERQLCDREAKREPLNSISSSEAEASVAAAEKALELERRVSLPKRGAAEPSGNKREPSPDASQGTKGKP